MGSMKALDACLDIAPGNLQGAGLAFIAQVQGQIAFNIPNAFLMEFCLHGMAACSLIGKEVLGHTFQFRDLMQSMFNLDEFAN